MITIVKKNLKSKLSEERKVNVQLLGPICIKRVILISVNYLRYLNADGRRDKKQGLECYCKFCIDLYVDPPLEDWIQCGDCRRWAHEAIIIVMNATKLNFKNIKSIIVR